MDVVVYKLMVCPHVEFANSVWCPFKIGDMKQIEKIQTRMWADAQRDGRPAEYRWRPLQKFRNYTPCTTQQSLADAHCWRAVQ